MTTLQGKELEKLIQNKKATRFMQPLEETPVYWERIMRFAHHGETAWNAHFLCTFSAAEMRWPEVRGHQRSTWRAVQLF